MKKIILGLFIFSLLLTDCSLVSETAPAEKIGSNESDQTPISGKVPVGQPAAANKRNLSGQQLGQVPADVFSQTNLIELDLSDNRLTGALPGEIRFLKNLKVLNASNNLMTGVPAEIGQLSGLEVLNLANNQLSGLPYELGNLQNLHTLDLSGNPYSEYDLAIIKQSLPETVNIIK